MFNVSEPVTYLFQRFDTYGEGLLRSDDFARGVLGVAPRSDSSHVLRVAAGEVREALSASLGLHGVRRVALELLRAGSELGVRAARALLHKALGERGSGSGAAGLEILLNEASRPHGYNKVLTAEVVEMLRCTLTRSGRSALAATWASAGGRAGGGGSLPLSALARAPASSLHLNAATVSKDFAQLWGAPLTLSSSVVRWEEWLDYGRDLAGGGGGESGLLDILRAAWALPVHHSAGGETTGAPPLPGSPVAALGSLATSAFFPSATARLGNETGRVQQATARFPPRNGGMVGGASESTGMPAILSQPLGRAIASKGWESFRYGVLQPFTAQVVVEPFGAGAPAARPVGGTFVPSKFRGCAPDPLPVGVSSVAGLWKGAPNSKWAMAGYTLGSGPYRF